MAYLTKLFAQFTGVLPDAGSWFYVHNVRSVLLLLIHKARRQDENDKWQWMGFWLDDWEADHLAFEMVRVYIIGADANPIASII